MLGVAAATLLINQNRARELSRNMKEDTSMRVMLGALIMSAVLSAVGPARANELDVPIVEYGGDGQMANCSGSVVSGLKPGGDGYLAVRSGPGSEYKKIDELHNGDSVIVFDVRGDWAGVVYRTQDVTCSSKLDRVIHYPNKGWTHTHWLRHVAG